MFDALTPLDILKRVVPEFEWRLGGDNPFAAPDIEASVGDVRVRVKHFGRQVESGGAGVHVELHHAQGMEEAFVVSQQEDTAERREGLARGLRTWLAERLPFHLHRRHRFPAWPDQPREESPC